MMVPPGIEKWRNQVLKNDRNLLGVLLLIFTFVSAHPVGAGKLAAMKARTGLGANDLSDVAWDGTTIWVTGSGTLTKKLWGDGRMASDWISYRDEPGFGRGSMGALYASKDIIIVSWLYSDVRNGQTVMNGDGFSCSHDGGETWEHVTILDLFPDRAGFTYPGTWTSTYDFAFSDGTLWASTTAGFLLRSDDLGATWKNIIPPPDTTMVFQNPNHHGQCVDAYGDTVWVGTFQGMNVSFDRGETWTNFSWPRDGSGDPAEPKPGNFCYAVAHKAVGGATHVWVGGSPYNGIGQYGICHTADNGETWEYKTTRYNAWNFAFGHEGASSPAVGDSTVFAASDSGLVVSYDLGETWKVLSIAEPDSIVRAVDDTTRVTAYYPGKKWGAGTRVYGLAVVGDTLWVTSSDGLAMSPDWGESWSIYKGVTRVRALDTGARNVGISSMFDESRTYAFPNPFSPSRYDRDYSRTRVQYALTGNARITITIHDYSGRLIREIVTDEFRVGGRDYQEVWDGRDSDGNIVPNGVYFYIIKTNKGDSARGKIMVVD